MSEVRTHRGLDPDLCGRVVEVGSGRAVVEAKACPRMTADDSGLVHGGFTFGVADHAAMVAVNEPTVVLVAAECSFLAPVSVGETMVATAEVTGEDGKRRQVQATVAVGGTEVLRATFSCAVPSRHVLAKT